MFKQFVAFQVWRLWGAYLMQFRHVFAAALVAVCGVLSSNAANAGTVRVDLLSGVDPITGFANAYEGTTVHFDPGTYSVTYATGGTYQAYDQCSVPGCDPNPGFQNGFAIYPGGFGANGPGVYYNIPFVTDQYSTYGPATFFYATPADALAAYQAALASGGMNQSINNAAFVPLIGPITFTIITATNGPANNVEFNMGTGCCWDYITGGVSLDVTRLDVSTTPLPAALPLFATGLGVLGWAARRRKRKAAVIAAA